MPNLHQPDAASLLLETSRGGREPCGGSPCCVCASGTKVRVQWAEGIRSEASLESRGCVCARRWERMAVLQRLDRDS